MALLLAESFENLAVADLGIIYGLVTNSANLSMSTTGARRATNGLRITNQNAGFTQGLAASGSTCGCGFWLACNGVGFINNTPLLAFMQGGTAQIQINVLNTGQCQILRNLTTIATSTGQVPLAGAYVELKGTISPSGGTIDVRVNGTAILTATGLNTQGGSTTNWDGVRIGSLANVAIDNTMDDLVVWDSSGSVNNDFMGDVAVLVSIPQTGNGTYADFTCSSGTNHGAMVADATNDNDGTYNSSATAGHRDTYNMGNISTTGIIRGVVVDLIARKDLTGLKQVCRRWRIGSTDYDGSTLTPGTTYTSLRQIDQVSPATGVAWTITEFNAAELGMKIIA